MDRNEWLHRYRVHWLKRRPEITSEELGEWANGEAHEALSAEYPDNPEKAVDDELEQQRT